MVSFDDLDASGLGTEPVAPLCSMDWHSESEFLAWFEKSVLRIENDEMERITSIRNNALRYKGFYNFSDRLTPRGSQATKNRPEIKEIYTNHTQDLIKTAITQILYNKPNTMVVPASNEAGDKQNARISKQLLESLKYQNRIEQVYFNALLQAQVAGEGYCFILWDENRGAVHPKYKIAEENKKLEIPLKDSNGDPIKDARGKPVTVRPPKRVGDIRHFTPITENVLLWPAYRSDEVPCGALVTYMHVEEAKKRWPDAEFDRKEHEPVEMFDYSRSDICRLANYVKIYKFYHRSTPEIPGGIQTTCTTKEVLEELRTLDIAPEAADGAEFGNMPFARVVDLNMPGELHGWSSMHNINQLQSRYDRATTLIDRKLFLSCHPKYVVQQGSTPYEKLIGDELLLEYTGAIPPQIINFPANIEELFKYSASLQERMEKLKGIFSISRGAPPPGTRSASQQMFWMEQQEQRSSLDRMNFHEFVVAVDRLTLGTAAAKYRDHDERLIKVMGRDKSWEVKSFDVESLASSFDIRVIASSALPESKFARTETLMNLNQAFPEVFKREEVLSMLDFGLDEKFVDEARIPILAAEFEQEMWQSGEEVDDPESFEDLIAHWSTHYRFLQTPSFKRQAKKTKDMVLEHVGMTEMLMWAKMKVNPVFVEQVKSLPQFPIVFPLPKEESPPPPPAPEPLVDPAALQGGAPIQPVPQQLPIPQEPEDPLLAGLQ